MSDFLDQVKIPFLTLIESQKVTITNIMYDHDNFGDALVDLDATTFKIRLLRDRSQKFAEVASNAEPNRWFDLRRVLSAIGMSSLPPEGEIAPELAANLIERNFEALESNLSASRYEKVKRAVEDMETEWAKRSIR